MIVVDANILLYAHDRRSPRHAAAAGWLTGVMDGPGPIGLSLATVLAFIRIITDPRVYEVPRATDWAVQEVQRWVGRGNVRLIAPTDRHWETLAGLLAAGKARGSLVMDAHLAALTIEHGATLATSDRDFARFPGLRTIDPTAA